MIPDNESRSSARWQPLSDVLRAAVACAMVVGLLHAAVSWMRRDVLRDLLRTWMSPDTAWMAPLGYLILFVALAIPLAVLCLAWRRLPALRLAMLLFGTLAAFSFVLLFPRLHQYAALALGVGIGVRLSTSAAARAAAWRRGLGRVAVGGAALTLLLYCYQTGRNIVHERRALAALPAAREGAPNVILLILDTVRASELSLYGAERPTTPTLQALAASGTTFDWAFSTAPWTLPSHASMFTGRYSSQQTGNWTTPLDGAHATLAGVLASYGYATGGFTANLVATPRGFGLDRGFSRYEDHRRSLTQMVFTTSLGQANSIRNTWHALVTQHWFGRAVREVLKFDFEPRYSYPDNDPKPAELVNAAFFHWSAGVQGRPYFAFLNYFDAHGPYESPDRYAKLFGEGDRVRDKYDRSIRYIDDAIGTLVDTLACARRTRSHDPRDRRRPRRAVWRTRVGMAQQLALRAAHARSAVHPVSRSRPGGRARVAAGLAARSRGHLRRSRRPPRWTRTWGVRRSPPPGRTARRAPARPSPS